MRLAAVLVFIGVVCGAVYFVFSHPSRDHLDELQHELNHLQAQNDELAEENEELEKQILALRDDPRVAERRAREAVGLARPDELIFLFDEPEEEQTVQIRLRVSVDGLELAGRDVKLEVLASRLDALDEQMPGAVLRVEVDDDVGPIERQRVIDIVEESSMESTVKLDEDDDPEEG